MALSNDPDQFSVKQPQFAFLLRSWLIQDGNEIKWRFSIEKVNEHKQTFFQSYDELITYLYLFFQPAQTDKGE